MSRPAEEHGPRDPARIDIEEPSDLHYWSEKFGVSHEELTQAVREAGDRADDVESRLGARIDIGTGG